MKSVIILCLGNDLMSDDAIGLRVAHAARLRLAGHPQIDIKESAESGAALLDLVVGYEHLIVVDSIRTGEQFPGFIHEFGPGHFPVHLTRSPHSLGIESLCRVGRIRGLSTPDDVRMIAVEVQDPFTLGNEMATEVEDAIDDTADLVAQRAFEALAQSPVSLATR